MQFMQLSFTMALVVHKDSNILQYSTLQHHKVAFMQQCFSVACSEKLRVMLFLEFVRAFSCQTKYQNAWSGGKNC